MIRRLVGSRAAHVPSADWGISHLAAAVGPTLGATTVAGLEEAAEAALGVPCLALGSARTAIWAALRTAPGVRRVWVPAYTCVAVPNAVAAAGLPSVWVDVAGANLDMEAVLAAAKPGDALIAQHTYGIPIDPDELRRARDRGIFVIEDRAHRFDGADPIGDVVVFSLEHSKVVSGGQGGLAHAADVAQAMAMRRLVATLPPVDGRLLRRVLMTSLGQIAFDWHAPLLDRAGSAMRRVLLRLPATSIPGQSDDELSGDGIVPTSMHPRLAALAQRGIAALDQNLAHRVRIGRIYRQRLSHLVPAWVTADIPLVRYPIQVGDADATLRECRVAGVDLGTRWFAAPVHPPGAQSSYPANSAPRAERLARTTLTLPTHPRVSASEARQIAEVVARVAVAGS